MSNKKGVKIDGMEISSNVENKNTADSTNFNSLDTNLNDPIMSASKMIDNPDNTSSYNYGSFILILIIVIILAAAGLYYFGKLNEVKSNIANLSKLKN